MMRKLFRVLLCVALVGGPMAAAPAAADTGVRLLRPRTWFPNVKARAYANNQAARSSAVANSAARAPAAARATVRSSGVCPKCGRVHGQPQRTYVEAPVVSDAPADEQDCYIDPWTGDKVCPLKAPMSPPRVSGACECDPTLPERVRVLEGTVEGLQLQLKYLQDKMRLTSREDATKAIPFDRTTMKAPIVYKASSDVDVPSIRGGARAPILLASTSR